MRGVVFRLEAGLRLDPFFHSLEVEDDAGALLVRGLGGGRWNFVQGFRYDGLPECHAYCMGWGSFWESAPGRCEDVPPARCDG